MNALEVGYSDKHNDTAILLQQHYSSDEFEVCKFDL